MSENTDDPYRSSATDIAKTPRRFPRFLSVFVGGVVLLVAAVIFLAPSLLPLRRNSRPFTYRLQCKNNLKQIMLALHNYDDRYGCFPPAVVTDSSGAALHSWRVLILPFTEQQVLYQMIDLSKPWDAPENRLARESCPSAFRCPSSDHPPGHTSYVAVTGENRFLHPTRGRTKGEFADGMDRTIAILELPRDQSVHWMSPQDDDGSALLQLNQESLTPHQDMIQVAFVNIDIHRIGTDCPSETRNAVLTISGGEDVGDF